MSLLFQFRIFFKLRTERAQEKIKEIEIKTACNGEGKIQNTEDALNGINETKRIFAGGSVSPLLRSVFFIKIRNTSN